MLTAEKFFFCPYTSLQIRFSIFFGVCLYWSTFQRLLGIRMFQYKAADQKFIEVLNWKCMKRRGKTATSAPCLNLGQTNSWMFSTSWKSRYWSELFVPLLWILSHNNKLEIWNWKNKSSCYSREKSKLKADFTLPNVLILNKN